MSAPPPSLPAGLRRVDYTRVAWHRGEPVEFEDVTGLRGTGTVRFDAYVGTCYAHVNWTEPSGRTVKRLVAVEKLRRVPGGR